MDTGSLFDVVSGNQSFILGKLSGMTDVQMALGGPDGEPEKGMSYKIIGGAEGKLFTPNGIAGINEKPEISSAFPFWATKTGI